MVLDMRFRKTDIEFIEDIEERREFARINKYVIDLILE